MFVKAVGIDLHIMFLFFAGQSYALRAEVTSKNKVEIYSFKTIPNGYTVYIDQH